MFLGGKPVEVLGKMYYRTASGDLVDLPSDMTAAQVIQLEAEARAAITKIGKGPPPQPVPDVKKLDKKEDKKTQLKPFAKGKKPGAAGKGAGKPKGRSSPSLSKVGTSKVSQYLATKAAPIISKGFARLQQLRTAQQTHDEAADKRTQAEASVVIPDSEGHSKSNSAQVSVVGDRPAPKVDPGKGKLTLQETLRENMPKKIEDVDNFKRDMKGQHTGAEVLKTVQGDKSAVVSTFQDMGNTPPPAPREHEPEPLPPTEIAPATGAMTLGKDGIAPLQKEHTDLSNFTNEGDKKLKEEGVTQEQLDMVDSGDLASANKEKKGMETAAKNEPIAVQKFAQEQGKSVETDLKKEETKNRAEMTTKRKTGLSATRAKQQGAKSDLEKKREEVATKINGIYTTAQNKVKKQLADLETQSMKRFDDGNNKATKDFEDNVNREIDAFKDDRYSGMFGWARKIRDWIKGIDDLPAVKAIFDRNREKFVAAINKLVEDISADNKRVIQDCKDELTRARAEIKDYVDKLGPSLKDIGKKAADEMSSKLDEMDKFVAKQEEELQNKLKDKQAAAIKAIDEKIEKMKEAMAGALAKLGKLLLWAAKKFFTWALEKFGFSLSEIEGIINKGAAVLKAIFTKPIQFVKNLMKAAILGFENFGKNFLKHLKDALFEWLTGSLQGLTLPSTWDFRGIISVALQMIGISYQNIRTHMVKVMGEPVVVGLEKTFELVKTLVTQGPMAAWDQLKEMAAEMRDAFVDAVKDFIKQKIVEQAIIWVGALLIPGAGIIKAIIGIYDTVVFFISKAKQIMTMIGNFLGSIAEIAAGNIGAAADALENGLARGLSLVISFLAALLRLSGVTNKIRDAIQKIRAKVDQTIEKVVQFIMTKAKRFFSGKPNEATNDAALHRALLEDAIRQFKQDDGAPDLTHPQWVAYKHKVAARLEKAFSGKLEKKLKMRIALKETGEPYSLKYSMSIGPNTTTLEGSDVDEALKDDKPDVKLNDTEYVISVEGGKKRTVLFTRIEEEPIKKGKARWALAYRFVGETKGGRMAAFLPTGLPAYQLLVKGPPMPEPTGWSTAIDYILTDDKGAENVGRIVKNVKMGDKWFINFHVRGERHGAPRTVPGYIGWDITKPAFRLPPSRGGLSPVITKSTTIPADPRPPGVAKDRVMDKAKEVGVDLLGPAKGKPPGSSQPVGWNRLSDWANWVRGHLWNEKLGGPRDEWNLVPIEATTNSQMNADYEEYLKDEILKGKAFRYSAVVDYHPNSASKDVGIASDFAEKITIHFTEISDAGGSWVPIPFTNPPKKKPPSGGYKIRVPKLSEIRGNRETG